MRPIVLATLIALAGCTAPYTVASSNPYPPPPPPRAEVVPVSPVSEDQLIWRPGHWNWDNAGGYVWEAGQYVPLAGHGRSWLIGYWSNVGGNWVWVPAHWV